MASVVAGVVLGIGAVAGLMFWDFGWNEAGLLDRIAGRESMRSACLTPLVRRLVVMGFSPVDIRLEPASGVSTSFSMAGVTRRLVAGFVFFDGENGPRVDGTVACVKSSTTTEVEVETDSRPRRVT